MNRDLMVNPHVQHAEAYTGSPFAEGELQRIADYTEATQRYSDIVDDWLQGGIDLTPVAGSATLTTYNDMLHEWTQWLIDTSRWVQRTTSGRQSTAMRFYLRCEAERLLTAVDQVNRDAVTIVTGRRGVSMLRSEGDRMATVQDVHDHWASWDEATDEDAV